MNDTLMRQWAMLRAIPRHPRRVGATTIHARLQDLGMAVSLRTVQRDLNTLAEAFPLDFDESKPQGWCWREGAGQLEIPSMDAHAALTFSLVEQYMQILLPRTTLSHMEPWFEGARGVAWSQASTVTKWQDKLRVVPHTFNKIPASIDPAVQETIYSAVMEERQVEVTYRALSAGLEAKTYPAHPLGLVVMEQVIYLVCTVKQYRDARFLAIHRIDAARLLPDTAIKPSSFNLDEFIQRELGIRLGTAPLQLVMRVRGVMSKYVAETPIAVEQTMEPVDADWTRLKATVPNTNQLRTWIRSLGADVVVEQPQELRMQLREELQLIQSHYGT